MALPLVSVPALRWKPAALSCSVTPPTGAPSADLSVPVTVASTGNRSCFSVWLPALTAATSVATALVPWLLPFSAVMA